MRVGDEVLIARRAVVVATGSGAAMPPIEGLDSVPAWNNREATTAKRVPESMVVLGGGPVGSELAQAWATPRHRGHPGRGRRPAAPARGALRRRGGRRRPSRRATVSTCAPEPSPSAWDAGRRIAVELDDGETVEGAEILVAVGRKPRTAGIGLESIGVEPGEGGFLEADDRMRVGGRDWLYAVGDVNGRALFTHMGKYQAWVAAENVPRPRGRGRRRRHRLAPGHVHRPPGRRRGQDARAGARGRDRGEGRRRPDRRHGRRQLPGQGNRRHLTPGHRRDAQDRSSAPPSPASRQPTSSTPPQSRSSAKSPSQSSATRSRPTPPAARSGSSSWKPTACRASLGRGWSVLYFFGNPLRRQPEPLHRKS